MYIQHTLQCASRLHSLFYLLDLVVIYLKTYIAILNIKKSLGLILKNKRSCSFSTRAEINSSRALPVIARVWLRHWLHDCIRIGFEPTQCACAHDMSNRFILLSMELPHSAYMASELIYI